MGLNANQLISALPGSVPDDDAIRRSAERSLQLADEEKLCRLATEKQVAALEVELSSTKSQLKLKEQYAQD